MKQNINIQIFRETAKSIKFNIIDDFGKIVDLTSATGTLNVFLKEPGQADVIALTKALTITNAIMGICQVDLLSTDTDIDEYNYTYKLDFIFSDAEVRTLTYGLFEIVGDDNTRISQIKQKYSLNFDYYTMREGLNYAHQQMTLNLYEKIEDKLNTTNKIIQIENYVMDKNFSYTVDKTDIEIIQYQDKTPFGVVDLSANIVSVLFDHPVGKTIITMDGDYPETSYKMQVTYYKGLYKFSEIYLDVKQVEEWYTLYHIFQILPIYKLQQGLPSRSINGVDIVFDQDGIDKLRKMIFTWIQTGIVNIKGFDIGTVVINKRY